MCTLITGCKFSSVLFITAQVDIKNCPKSTIVYDVMHCSTITSTMHVINLGSYHNIITIIIIIDSAVTIYA